MVEQEQILDVVHTGPGTLAGQYIRRFWHPFHRSEDLGNGQAIPITVLGEQFTLYRGEAGQAHVVAFRCAHRGTQLSVGWVEGDCIRCRYHGWMYDGSGQCVEQPGEDEGFARRVSIRSYPTEEYLGLIFAYFGDETPPPPLRRYPEFHAPGLLIADPVHQWPCNYFQIGENDNFHVVYTHRTTALRMEPGAPIVFPPPPTSRETPYGYTTTNPADPAARGAHYHLPNVSQIRIKTKQYYRTALTEDRLFWHVPVDDTHSYRISTNLVHISGADAAELRERRRAAEEIDPAVLYETAEEVLAGRRTVESLGERFTYYQQFYIEDYVTEVGQGTIVDRQAEHLWPPDIQLLVKRRIFQRELMALAEGRALTEWKEGPMWPPYEPNE